MILSLEMGPIWISCFVLVWPFLLDEAVKDSPMVIFQSMEGCDPIILGEELFLGLVKRT